MVYCVFSCAGASSSPSSDTAEDTDTGHSRRKSTTAQSAYENDFGARRSSSRASSTAAMITAAAMLMFSTVWNAPSSQLSILSPPAPSDELFQLAQFLLTQLLAR